ncbi:uncharacterized protein MONOS_15371 [Monocercomonoides exilis]|uniref:uncharacterized protein n=1 Tax=Monocercomonoides exilis TaxID=2049356 RepID=UPI00355A943E|nr:hypothetical protein MONOS_15371 [Monocercomonoides exilis]|eukprot:MONOS_15371.1-p1 / transcript=MONOS_15371.1 / gene=MONOS_15371 / organism=Monocercomonoides_exilis_PA203 / gene_product=unspecified product / transcript_product=unspecified product / location=Mono_scaffold01211:11715-12268(+) / protein_length=130 / sequence_SO=supercontig / SO=protein_coding / is_pseudo=false
MKLGGVCVVCGGGVIVVKGCGVEMGKDNEKVAFKLSRCRGMFWNIMLRGVGRGGNVCGRPSRALKKDSQMNSMHDSVYENGTEGKEKKKKKKRLEKQDEKKKNEFLTKKGRYGNAKPTSIRSIRQKTID